jgi:hypothetical protein
MNQRIMVTGIPNYQSTMIDRVDGINVHYVSTYRDLSLKGAFLKGARAISNTGNYLIGEAALMAMRPQATTIMPFWRLQESLNDSEFYRSINSSFDICVFTAANLIRNDFDADMEARVLERINVPIVILGAGIQRVSDLDAALPPGTQKLIALLADRDAIVMTRGDSTASFLKMNGVRRATATGCPSMFHLSNNVRRAWRKAAAFRVTESSDLVFSGYLGHESHFGTPRDINAMVPAGRLCSYVMQDEMLHWDMGIEGGDNEPVWNPSNGRIDASTTFLHQEKIRADLQLHLFFDPVQWRAWISRSDFALQRRFHGSIAALQAAVPSLMIAIDDRMKEMLNFIRFPFIDPNEWVEQTDKRGYLNACLEAIDLATVIGHYDECEISFRAQLRDAGLC